MFWFRTKGYIANYSPYINLGWVSNSFIRSLVRESSEKWNFFQLSLPAHWPWPPKSVMPSNVVIKHTTSTIKSILVEEPLWTVAPVLTTTGTDATTITNSHVTRNHLPVMWVPHLPLKTLQSSVFCWSQTVFPITLHGPSLDQHQVTINSINLVLTWL